MRLRDGSCNRDVNSRFYTKKEQMITVDEMERMITIHGMEQMITIDEMERMITIELEIRPRS